MSKNGIITDDCCVRDTLFIKLVDLKMRLLLRSLSRYQKLKVTKYFDLALPQISVALDN